MIGADVVFRKSEFPDNWVLPNDLEGRVLVGGVAPDVQEQYFLLDFGSKTIDHCSVNVSEYATSMERYLKSRISLDALPYGHSTHLDFAKDFLCPHEGLETAEGEIVISMNNAPYMRRIDFSREVASTYSKFSAFHPIAYSATNSLSSNRERIFFAECDFEKRVQQFCDSATLIPTVIMSCKTDFSDIKYHAQIDAGELLHEVKISPDGNYIVLTEFRSEACARPPAFDNHNDVFAREESWEDYRLGGPGQSEVYLVDLRAKTTYTFSPNVPTPAHVEFSKLRSDTIYLSSHNLSRAHGRVILHGTGAISQCAINQHGIALQSEFSCAYLHRMSAHQLFVFQKKHYLVAAAYPSRLVLFDGVTMEYLRTIEIFAHEDLPPRGLFFCPPLRHYPRELTVSDNGRYAIMLADSAIYVCDMFGSNSFVLNNYAGDCSRFRLTAHVVNLND